MALTDLESFTALARAQGAIVVTDNTFASSFNQLPLTLGVDLVVHFATKYLNGHSDVAAGVVVGPRKLSSRFANMRGCMVPCCIRWRRGCSGAGSKPMRYGCASTINLGRSWRKHLPKRAPSRRSIIPASPRIPQHELARRQMPAGFGGMMSFVVEGSTAQGRFNRAQMVLRNVRLCISAVSLGGTESLIMHPASMTFSHQSPDQLSAVGVEPGLLRLSVGLEHHQDITDDLAYALSGARDSSQAENARTVIA
jgi:cystathionine beta-lyase/cystathionine gamma-synthase